MFDEHIRGLHSKATKKLSALNRVASSVWGFESRILSITVHALVESVVNYGLPVYGAHYGSHRAEEKDRSILNKAARKVAGTGISLRRGMVNKLADAKSFYNHSVLKV